MGDFQLMMVLRPIEVTALQDAIQMAMAVANDDRRTVLYGILMRLRAMEPICRARNVT